MTWLESTGQRWKFGVFTALLLGGGAAIFAARLVREQRVDITLSLAGVISALCSLVWLRLSIRCVSCREPVAWRMISTRPHGTWLAELLALRECPKCHSSPARRER